MPRLDYIATLRDNVTPGLERLAEAAESVGGSFANAQTGGTRFTEALTRAGETLAEGFEDISDSVSTLVLLRVLGVAAAGAFTLLLGSVNLFISIINTGLNTVRAVATVARAAFGILLDLVFKLTPLAFRLFITIFRGGFRAISLFSNGVVNGTIGLGRYVVALMRGERQLITFRGALRLVGGGVSRVARNFGSLLRVTTVFAIKAALVAAALAAIAFGAVFLFRQFQKLLELIPSVDEVLAFFGRGAEAVGKFLGDLAFLIIPKFAEGLVGSIINNLKIAASVLTDGVIGGLVKLRNILSNFFGPRATAAAEALVETYEDVRDGVVSVGEGAARAGQSAGELAGEVLPKLQRELGKVTRPAAEALAALQRFEGIQFDSVAGSVAVSGSALTDLFTTATEVSTAEAAKAAQAVDANTRKVGLAGVDALNRLVAGLPDPLQAHFAPVIRRVTSVELQTKLANAWNSLIRVFSDPENFRAFILENRVTEDVANARAALVAAQAEVEGLWKKHNDEVAKINKEAAEEEARRNRAATLQQFRAFLQASGQAVRGRRDHAIALATIDAGVAIAGAFAHGTNFGPAYLAAYVGTVVANLSNTLNSIRSQTTPAGLTVDSLPDPSGAQQAQQAQAPAQISLSIQSEQDTFSAATVRGLVEDINEAQSGQLTA